jgi:glycosyltransferase 2 family protein
VRTFSTPCPPDATEAVRGRTHGAATRDVNVTPGLGHGRRIRMGIAVRLVVASAVVGAIAWRVDWSGSATALTTASLPLIGIALLAFTASAALKAVIWAGLLRGVAPDHGIRARHLVSPVFVGLLGNWFAPARLGEAARVVACHRGLRRHGVGVEIPAIAGTVAGEVIVSTLAWAAVTLAAAALLPVPGYVIAVTALVGVGTTALLAVAVRGVRVPAWNGGNASRARRLARAVVQSAHSAGTGLRGLTAPGRFATVTGAALAAITLQWVATALVMEGLGVEAGVAAAATVLATTTVAQAVPLLPGSIGSYQAAVVLPLTTTYDVSAADALTVSLVLHLAQVVTGTLPGAVCLVREGRGGLTRIGSPGDAGAATADTRAVAS